MIPQKALDAISQAGKDGKISKEALGYLMKWANSEAYGAFHADIVKRVDAEEWTELGDEFGEVLPFGTGGRRGAMGVGPNRINDRTIGESAQGLAVSILKAMGAPGRRLQVAIAFDTRNGSQRFAGLVAGILAGNGIKALLFDGPRSTPELSFAVRHTHSDAGIVISASHNPPADNGFKAYWADGGQVVPPHDGSIIEEVVKVAGLTRMPEAEAKAAGLLEIIGPEIDDVYARYTAGLCLTEHRDLSIVFSPLHGTGTTSVWPALKTAGFTKLFPVDEQWSADGNFPGVPNQSPNPEIPAAMEAGKALAARVGADLVIASDPDADRLGVVVCARGATTFLNGNQIGILLVDHIVETLAAKGGIPPGAVVYKTLVTTDLIDRICGEHGVAVSGDLLVGFKYVAEAIQSLADPNTFLFGTEESHGYLRGPAVRDKDAAQAAVLLCERAAAARSIGRSLLDDLDSIYRRYGYFREVTRGVTFNETGGIHKMREVMQGLRSNPPKELGGERIAAVIDRQLATRTDPATGRQSADVTGARGNVLVFLLSEDGTDRVTIRPSGTEPKIKVYVQVHQDDASNLEAARRAVDGRASALMAGIETLARR